MLQSVERTIKNHELSHMVTGGAHSGAATYDYRRGPDGGMYAMAGGVSIDMTVTGSYDKVIEKMQTVKRVPIASRSLLSRFCCGCKGNTCGKFRKIS